MHAPSAVDHGRGGATAANGITIYIDGLELPIWRSTEAGYVAMENLTAPLTFGRGTDSANAFDGALDELRLWNVLRTQGALQAGMVAELVGNETGLAAYWRLNEGIGWSAGDDSPGTATAALLRRAGAGAMTLGACNAWTIPIPCSIAHAHAPARCRR